MSDPFSHKDYGAYFETLSQQIKTGKTDFSSVSVRKKPLPKLASRRKTRINPSAILTGMAAVALVIFLILLLIPKKKPKYQKTVNEVVANQSEIAKKTVKDPIRFQETENTVPAPDSNDAQSLIMIQSDTNEIITLRNPKQRLYPASTTKIMTILVAAERTEDFEESFQMTREITDAMYIAGATVAGFSAGEQVNITDLLYGTILASGGDAALGLAEKLAGSEEAFVVWMNKKAEELGLCDTHFTNVTGLHDPNHYTTAYDLAIILKTALKNPICKEVLSTYRYTTKATEQHAEGIKLEATLFKYMYGTEPETAVILGGKTGFVNESGYCIATYGKNNTTGTEYIAVTLKNSAKWPAIHGQIALYKEFAK